MSCRVGRVDQVNNATTPKAIALSFTRSFFFTRPRDKHVSGAPGRRFRDRRAIHRKSASECPGRSPDSNHSDSVTNTQAGTAAPGILTLQALANKLPEAGRDGGRMSCRVGRVDQVNNATTPKAIALSFTRSFFFTRPRDKHVSGAPGRRFRDRRAIHRKSASECPGRSPDSNHSDSVTNPPLYLKQV